MPKMRPKVLKPGMTESMVLAGTLEALHHFGLSPERRNTGGRSNAKGRYVQFNAPGTPDLDVILTPAFAAHCAGKLLRIETKREGWRPERARGSERVRFESQLARLVQVNRDGGYGFWCDDPARVMYALGRIKEGWRIEFVGDYPFLVLEVDA